MKKISFRKILANASAVFISTFAGIVTANGLITLDISPKEILILATFPALIQAAMAFCNEWKKAEETLEQTTGENSDSTVKSNLSAFTSLLKKLNLKDFILFDD